MCFIHSSCVSFKSVCSGQHQVIASCSTVTLLQVGLVNNLQSVIFHKASQKKSFPSGCLVVKGSITNEMGLFTLGALGPSLHACWIVRLVGNEQLRENDLFKLWVCWRWAKENVQLTTLVIHIHLEIRAQASLKSLCLKKYLMTDGEKTEIPVLLSHMRVWVTHAESFTFFLSDPLNIEGTGSASLQNIL